MTYALPLDIFIGILSIVIAALVYFIIRNGQLARGKARLVRKISELENDRIESEEALIAMKKALADNHDAFVELIITLIARTIYMDISIFREQRQIWDINIQLYEFKFEPILKQLLYFQQVKMGVPKISTNNGPMERAQRLGAEKWVQDRFALLIQDPANIKELTDDPQLAAGDLYLVDSCIRAVLEHYPEKNPTTPQSVFVC